MSSLTPRPPHPPPASPAIARVLPMVPEVSLFTPGQAHSPYPQLLPTHHLRPQSDLSIQFQRSEATLFLSGSSAREQQKVPALLPHTAAAGYGQTSAARDQPHTAGMRLPLQTRALPRPLIQTDTSRIRFPHQVQYLPQHLHEQVQPSPPQHPVRLSEKPQPFSHSTVNQQEQVVSDLKLKEHEQIQPNPQHPVHQYRQALPLHQVSSPPTLPVNDIPAQPSAGSTSNQTTPIHPDIMTVLNWQNSQLARLQDQVARLLAASPQSADSSPVAAPGTPASAPPSTTQAGTDRSPLLKKITSPPSHKASVSTSTSTLWPDMQIAMARLRDDSSSASPHPTGCLDMPDYPTTPTQSDRSSAEGQLTRSRGQGGMMDSWESPVLGESVSMYEGNSSNQGQENVEEMYENILGQVKRLLAQDQDIEQPGIKDQVMVGAGEQLPLGSLDYQQQRLAQAELNHVSKHDDSNSSSRKENLNPKFRQDDFQALNYIQRQHPVPVSSGQEINFQVPQDERIDSSAQVQSTNTATWERLRQLGVSFISPSDLAPAQPTNSAPYNSVYLPQANIPSNTIFSPSPDTSLAINSLALKYLSDRELTRLATQHTGGGGRPAARPTDYSIASHQYMARYGLGQQDSGAPGGQDRAGIRQAVTTQQTSHPVQPRPQHQQNNPHYMQLPQHVRQPQLGGPPLHVGPPQHGGLPRHVGPAQLLGRQARTALSAPDIEGRVLNITAIRQQSKLL